MKKLFIATTMVLILMLLTLMACVTPIMPLIQSDIPTLSPIILYTPLPQQIYILDQADPAALSAQATLIAGQNEINSLSYQATLVALNINLAARAAAQATLDYNQAQLLALSIRGTEVAQNMAWAAATQQSIADNTKAAQDMTATAQQSQVEQTQMVWNATSTAQSQLVTATYAAYMLAVTQTAQGQMVLDAQDARYAQANATQIAYALTATPIALIQSSKIQAQTETNRKSAWIDFVVNPLTVALMTLIILVVILGWVFAFRRFMPVFEMGLRKYVQEDDRPVVLLEGRVVESVFDNGLLIAALPPDQTPKLTSISQAQVEIVGPDDPSITNWITEAEQKLRSDGWIQT